jgi:CRISPR-associated protein Csc2
LKRDAVQEAMEAIVPQLLHEDGVVFKLLDGERLQALLQETLQITSDETRLKSVLTQANAETLRYAQTHGVDAKEAKAKK